jgi:Holliday junction DNA helicase RuvA
VIASLSGTVLALSQTQVIIDVSGVGYQVFVAPQTSMQLTVGDSTLLHTALIVREDSMTLYGFANTEELELFHLLHSVTGVGPKSALAVLAELSADQIRMAVLSEDDTSFKRVSGIGPKTAKLITVTLAGKLNGISASATTASTAKPKSGVDLSNLTLALQGLGWPERSAAEAVRSAASDLGELATADALLKAALAKLGGGKSISGGDQ